jgi:hypothetical protein
MLLVSLLIALQSSPFVLLCSPTYAFEDEAFKLAKHEYNDRMEYAGKQRYSEAVLRNDPEVLISSPNKPVIYEARKVDSVITEVKKDESIIVESCVEYNGKCEPSSEFRTVVK